MFDMINHVEQQDLIRIILAHDQRIAHLVPIWQDMNVLESVVAVLAPLLEFTDLLAGEAKVTIILPLLTPWLALATVRAIQLLLHQLDPGSVDQGF